MAPLDTGLLFGVTMDRSSVFYTTCPSTVSGNPSRDAKMAGRIITLMFMLLSSLIACPPSASRLTYDLLTPHRIFHIDINCRHPPSPLAPSFVFCLPPAPRSHAHSSSISCSAGHGCVQQPRDECHCRPSRAHRILFRLSPKQAPDT